MINRNHSILYFDTNEIHFICNGDDIAYDWSEYETLIAELADKNSAHTLQVFINSQALLLHKIKAPKSIFRRLQLVLSKSANKNLLDSIAIKRKLFGFWQDRDDLVFCFAVNQQQADQFDVLHDQCRAQITDVAVIQSEGVPNEFTQLWLGMSKKTKLKIQNSNKISFSVPKVGAIFQPIPNTKFFVWGLIIVLPMIVAVILHQYQNVIIPIVTKELLSRQQVTMSTNEDILSFKVNEAKLRLNNQQNLSRDLHQQQSSAAKKYSQLSSLVIEDILLDEIHYSHKSLDIAGSVKSIADFYAFTSKLTEFGGIITLNDLKKLRQNHYYFSLNWSELTL